jgi:hypothetical protein
MTHAQKFSTSVQDFLLFGPSDDSGLPLSVEKIESEWEEINCNQQALRAKLNGHVIALQSQQLTLQSNHVMSKYLDLCSLEAEYELRQLHQLVDKLANSSDPRLLPAIVEDIVRVAPSALPVNTKIYSYLTATCDEVSRLMLQSFHSLFEDHLEASSINNTEKNSWAVFYDLGKHKVIAYVLACLLPHVIAAARDLADIYEKSLDMILSPLWSRFYFHLVAAREDGSLNQVLWTFEFAKIFCQSLIGLFEFVTSSTCLMSLVEHHGIISNNTFLLDKVSRFMRAHISQCIDSLTIVTREEALCFAECAIEFDGFLTDFGVATLYTTTVVRDYPLIFNFWIHADVLYVKKLLLSAIDTDDCLTSVFIDSNSMLNQSADEFFFSFVYQSCWIMTHMCPYRYNFLDELCIDTIYHIIVEPVILSAMGFVLFQIRTDPLLVSLSKGNLVKSCADHFKSVTKILNSVNALIAALLNSKECKFVQHFICINGRFHDNWKSLRTELSANIIFSGSSRIKNVSHILDMTFLTPEISDESIQVVNQESNSCKVAQDPGSNRGNFCDILDFAAKQLSLISEGLQSQWIETLELYKLPKFEVKLHKQFETKTL